MRIYVSVDVEGLPGIFHPEHLSLKRSLFDECRRVMSKVVTSLIDILLNEGVDEVWVADSHGFMGTLPYLEVPSKVRLIRGFPRPLAMVYGIDRGFDGAMFIGYHSAAGTYRSVFDHTFSGRAVHEVRINGRLASEFYINALIASHYGVPVILVLGDDKLRRDVKEVAPWAEYVEVKESVARYAAVMKPIDEVIDELNRHARLALSKLRRGEVGLVKLGNELVMEVVLKSTCYADLAEELPGVERVNAYTIRYVAKDPIDLHRTLDLIVMLSIASDTLRSYLSS